MVIVMQGAHTWSVMSLSGTTLEKDLVNEMSLSGVFVHATPPGNVLLLAVFPHPTP
jgi:hypothetical protein